MFNKFVSFPKRKNNGHMHFCSIKYRRVADRPRDPAKWSEIADIVASLSIPVIANGDIFEYDDFQRIKVATGSNGNDKLKIILLI